MNQYLCIFFTLFIVNSSIAGVKVTVENDTIKGDGEPIAIMKTLNGHNHMQEYRILNFKEQELVFIKYHSYEVPDLNEKGDTIIKPFLFYEFIFTAFKKTAELGSNELGFAMINRKSRPERMAHILVRAGVFFDTSLDIPSVKAFLEEYGNAYSKRKNDLLKKYPQVN